MEVVEPAVMQGIPELPDVGTVALQAAGEHQLPADAAPEQGDRDQDTPWADFNRTVHFRSMLIDLGWRFCGVRDSNEHFTRPGKDAGTSATLRNDGVFYVFTSNAEPLEPNKGYDAWGVHVRYNFKGDFRAAAAEWRKMMRKPQEAKVQPPPAPSHPCVSPTQLQPLRGPALLDTQG